jgi:3-deoxy-D-manno-octulosonate 8-phosphate phosphatase (KDO 8-P phosphatase)
MARRPLRVAIEDPNRVATVVASRVIGGSRRTAAEELEPILARARLLVLDIDGVLTDGRLLYGKLGPQDELQCFHVHDGIALRWIQDAGVVVAWVSGRGSAAARARARALAIEEQHQRAGSKRDVVSEIQSRRGIAVADTIAMGDDLPDLGLAARAALFAVPSDARPELRERAQLVTREGGGSGAVRELCERILRAKGRWQAILDAALR